MAMTLTGFVYDNAGNAISGATVQGYVSADNATTTAESSTTTDSNGKWSITTSTASRIPMDVKITYGSNVRWIKAGDKVNVTDMTVTGTLTVGEDAAGFDFSLFSSDTSGDGLTWDASEEVLQITGKDANTALDVLDGDVRIVDKLYFYDRGGEYLSSDGSTLTITGATTVSGGLTSTAASNTFGATSFNDASITNVNDIALDSISADGTDINVAVSDNSATSFTVKQGSDAYLIIDTANSSESVSIGTGISGTAITLGHSTSEVTVADNLTVTGDLTVNGTTTTVDTTNTVVKDSLIELNTGASSNSSDLGVVMERGSTGDNAIIAWDESADGFVVGTTTATGASTGDLTITAAPLVASDITAATLDISGNIDIDGTTNLDAVDIDGAVQLDSTFTIGENDQGYDVIFYGNAASANMTWDTSADDLILNGAARIVVPDGQLVLGSTAVSATAAELNLLDGNTSVGGSITIADTDGFVVNDGGTMKTIPASDINTYVGDSDTTYSAGSLLDLSGTTFNVDLTESAEAAIADGDYILFLDGGATGTQSKEAVHDLATLFAGAGMTATSSVLNVIGGDGITANANDVAITAAQTTVTSVYNSSLVVGYGASDANINFATDNQIIFDIDGTAQIELLDGILQPVTDADINLGAADKRFQTLYGQQYHMDASADGIADHSYSGMSATIRVGDGANVGAFDLVCISDVTNEVQVADADAIATSRVIGINPSNSAISDNSEGTILLHGFVRDDDWDWTTGATLYLGTGGTGSTITATAPSGTNDCVVPIGIALEPDMIYFNPTQTIIEHA